MLFAENIKKWRSELKEKYRKGRSKIRFGPRVNAVADIEDLFVDLELLEDRGSLGVSPKGSIELHLTGRKLTSYEELLTLTDRNMEPSHHVVICGNAGSGKTTLMSRIAYEWAKSEDVEITSSENSQPAFASTLKQMTLLFVLNIHKFRSNETLSMAIKKQALPCVLVDDIEEVLGKLKKGCLILLDGYDEMPKGTVNHALEDEILSGCFVIVTTRVHKVDDFYVNQTGHLYSIVKLLGFSSEKSLEYIKKFFSQGDFKNSELAETLIQQVIETPFLSNLASYPILLVMICIVWMSVKSKNTVLHSVTDLYKKALMYLNKPFQEKAKATCKLDSLLIKLGKPALDNLLQNSLLIKKHEFGDDEILDQACKVGILVQEEGLLVNDATVVFIHKTFQEYCAAVYLANLVGTNREMFNLYLEKINKNKVDEMEYLLKFCCGQNVKAAEAILEYIEYLVDVPKTETFRQPWQLSLVLLHETELSLSAATETKAVKQLQSHLVKVMEQQPFLNIHTKEMFNAIQYFSEAFIEERNSWLYKIKKLNFANMFLLDTCTVMRILTRFPALERLQKSGTQISGHIRNEIKVKGHDKGKGNNDFIMTRDAPLMIYVSETLEKNTFSIDFDVDISPLCNRLENVTIDKCGSERSVLSSNSLIWLLKCMPVLKKVTINGIEVADHCGSSMLPLCKSLQEVQMSCFSLTASTLMKLLGSMSSVTLGRNNKLTDVCNSNTVVKIIGHISSIPSISIKRSMQADASDFKISCSQENLLEFQMRRSPPIVNTILRRQSCLQTHGEHGLAGKNNESMSQPYESQQQSQMMPFSLDADTMIRLLDCMPIVSTVNLHGIGLTGEVDISITPICESLQVFEMEHSFMTTTTMMRLLASMPAVRTVRLNRLELAGEVVSSLMPSCKSLQNLQMKKCSMSANMMMRLLDCTPAVTSLTLDAVELTGEVDDSISPSCKSLKGLRMKKCSMSANMMMRLLDCIPAVTTLTLDEMELTGAVDASISPSCKSLKELRMKKCSMSANMMMRLLDCTPAVTTLTLDEMKLAGEVDTSISASCKSLQGLHMKKCSVSANMMMRLLDCIPAVTRLTLDEMKLAGEVDVSISPSCKSLKKLTMKKCFMSANMMMRLLDCTSVVLTLTLDGMELIGEVDVSISASCKSQKELHMKKCSVSANMMVRLLDCIPAVTTLTLDEMKLAGEVDESILSSCKSLQTLQVIHSSLTSNTMMRIFVCMPKVTMVTLDRVHFTDESHESECNELYNMIRTYAVTMQRLLSCIPSVTNLNLFGFHLVGNVDKSLQCESLQEFQMVYCSQNTNTLMKLLSYMPSVTTLALDRIMLTDEAGKPKYDLCHNLRMTFISVITIQRLMCCMPSLTNVTLIGFNLTGNMDETLQCEALQECQMENCSQDSKSVMGLLSCMPSVTTLTLNRIHLTDEPVKPEHDQWRFVRISVNSIQKLLRCIPSVAKLMLSGFNLEGNVDKSLRCVSLQEFKIENCSQETITMMRLLSCMPSVTKLTLTGLHLVSSVDIYLPCESVQELKMKDCCLDTNTILRLLSCMWSVKTLTLDSIHLTENAEYDYRDTSVIRSDTMQKLLNCIPKVTNVTLIGIELEGSRYILPQHVAINHVH